MNRRGFAGDVLTWGLLLCILILCVIVVGKVIRESNDEIQADTTLPAAARDVFNTYDSKYAASWDNAIALAVGLIFMMTFIFAWQIGTNPAYFWITLMILVSFLSALVGLNNALVNFFNADSFIEIKADMPFTSFIVDHFMLVMIGGAGLLMVVLFAKMRSEQ